MEENQKNDDKHQQYLERKERENKFYLSDGGIVAYHYLSDNFGRFFQDRDLVPLY
jgi:hypothetical protein